jgi:hypothetical protein
MNPLHITPALLSPAATRVVGLVVAYLAFQQWRLARRKLKLDLFEKCSAPHLADSSRRQRLRNL